MTRYQIIVNPISGRGGGERAIPLIKEYLNTLGLRFDLVRTERPWHAADLAQAAALAGYDAVVAVGGDGTANEVLNGLMRVGNSATERPAMGILCVGRGNDFAYAVGSPKDLGDGCRALCEDKPRIIDIGRVVGGFYPQGRYFGNGVGIGFDAVVGFEALKIKHLHGFPNYVVAALKTLFLYYRAPRVCIDFGRATIEQPSLLVSIMNGRRMGGGFLMAPRAICNDGLFDLCIARQASRAAILKLMPRFMQGTQAGHPAITTARAQYVRITAMEGSLPAHADGETLCTEGQRLDLEVLPGQLQVLAPSG